MEDKILKQIEEEAKKRLPKLWDRISQDTFIEGAKFGYNIKESVDKCSCCHELINGQLFCIDCFYNNINKSDMQTAEEIISPFIYGNYDNPDDASGLPEGDYIEESKCLKAMKEYAQQESEKAVREFKNELLKEVDSWNKHLLDKAVISIVQTDYLIEKLK